MNECNKLAILEMSEKKLTPNSTHSTHGLIQLLLLSYRSESIKSFSAHQSTLYEKEDSQWSIQEREGKESK